MNMIDYCKYIVSIEDMLACEGVGVIIEDLLITGDHIFNENVSRSITYEGQNIS